MFRRSVQVYILISVAIVCISCHDYRHRERFNRRSFEGRPSRSGHSILTGSGDDGHGYELQLDGDSHITSYLKALDVPEPLYRNPHIIASFDESLIPMAMARRLAQRRASEAEASSTIESNQSTSNNQTRDEIKPKDKDEQVESVKPVEIVQSRPQEPMEELRQEKETITMKEPEIVMKQPEIMVKKEEQLNPLESRLPIGGRMTKEQSEEIAKYQEVLNHHQDRDNSNQHDIADHRDIAKHRDIPNNQEVANYHEEPSRSEPREKRPTIRVTQMETQEFTERGRGSSQEPREFVLLMDSDRSADIPTLHGNLRPRPRASPRSHPQQNTRQTLLVPVPFEQTTSIREQRSQAFRTAQLGSSPTQMKLSQVVPEYERDTRTRLEKIKDAIRDYERDEKNRDMEDSRYPKSSSRSPLINSCLQLCSCCSALMGKNLVPLLV